MTAATWDHEGWPAESVSGPPINGEAARLRAIPASRYSPRSSRWLWENRIPQSGITLLAGREGIGKSTWDALLAAQITQGRMPGCHAGVPKSVGIVATEDAWEEVIVPRLMAAGADRDRVFNIEANVDDTDFGTITLPADVRHLPELCVKHEIVLLILDPVMSLIHGSLDTHHDREARKALDPLANFARTEGVAIVANIHVNKSATNDALNSIMASRAFTAVARSVLYCVVDPDSERGDRYLLGHPKCNVGPKQPILQYHLVTTRIDQPEDSISTSRVVVDGEDGRSLDAVMESRDRQRPGPGSDLPAKIVTFVRSLGRAVSSQEIAAEFSEISGGTVRSQLSRMAKRGELTHPGGVSGLWAIPTFLTAATATDEIGAATAATATRSVAVRNTGATGVSAGGSASVAVAADVSRARAEQDPSGVFDWGADEPEPPDEE